MKKFLNSRTAVLAVALGLAVIPLLGAQVQADNDVITPVPQFQDHGGVTPWFWIGLKGIFSAGYNIETGAGGFRDYGGDNNTYASFNFAFVDSHYQAPKLYEVPRNLDADVWTGRFKMMNFTSKINSWSQDEAAVENRAPSWLAEITGHGAHIGFFTQAGALIGSLNDDTTGTTNKIIASISGGNKVLQLGGSSNSSAVSELDALYYEKYSASHKTTYTASDGGAIWYLGYEKPELFNAYLTLLSEGNVNSKLGDVEGGGKTNDGFAGVLDFMSSPLGQITDEENPLTFKLTGNAITGFNFESSSENLGFGLKADGGFYLGRDNFVLAPTIAFDGKLDVNNEFSWKLGGGLIFQFSGMRWVTSGDDWNDLDSLGNQDFRYENSKVLKYAYAQAYAAYSELTDLDLIFRIEEPDGNVGFHEKLGAMLELRLYDVTETAKPQTWATQGRVSWDCVLKGADVTPYLRSYLDSNAVFKLRLGAYANIIPYTGFELAYTSANLNQGADGWAYPGNISPTSTFDAGRIELVVIFQSDNTKPRPPKRMNEWSYPATLSDL
jgi:hypothetical protein